MKPAGRLIEKQVKLVQSWFTDDIETSRKAQDVIGELGAKVYQKKISFEPFCDEPFQAEWACPKRPVRNAAILYLHGGGYTAGSVEYAKGFGAMIADKCNVKTLCVGYRLAPENPYPAAMDDVMEAYRMMLLSYPAERIAVIGESAGGGMCYTLSMRARDEGIKPPRCIVALSPWTDLCCDLESYKRNEGLDPTLTQELLTMFANMYAPNDKKNPYVSPLYGDMRGLPESLIFAGTHEVLEDDSIFMSEKLNEAGSKCTLHVEEGGWHVYVLYGVYESRQAMKRIKVFIREKICNGKG